MRKLIFGAMAALMAVSGAAQAKPVTLKLAFFAGAKDSTFSRVIRPWTEDVARDSQGTLKIDAFPGGTLGRNPRVQVKLVQDGVADIAFFVPAYTPGRFPDNEVMELPATLRNSHESSIAIWRLYAKGLLRGYEKFKVLMLTTTHPYAIHTKFPMKRIADLKGKKLRAGGPVAGAAIRALGAVPVGMPIPAVAENISKGIISGAAADWNVMYAFRIVDVARHHYMAQLGSVPIGLIMRKERFAALPAAARAALDKHGGEAMSRRYAKVNMDVQRTFEARTEKNSKHTFVRPSPAAMKEWDATVRPVIENWVKKHPKGRTLLDALHKELAAIRAEKK